MTDILCKWLNEDVCLEPKLTKSSFSDVFSNGYLFGEVLHKHGLQPDFAQFSNAKSSEAKLNNFTRLEPTFKLLEIPFNINLARDVMTERPGVATRLLYQLFVALNRVKDGRVTGQSLESVRPSGRVKLERIETGIFQKRLKQQTPRQVDLNFEGLIQKFQQRQKSFEEKLSSERKREEEMIQTERRELCHKSLEKSREVRERQAQLYAKLKPLSPSKPPPTTTRSKTTGSITERGRSRRVQAEALATREGIDNFEAALTLRGATTVSETRPLSTGNIQEQGRQAAERTHGPSSDYVAQIRKRVQDSELARKEREKRRKKVLVEQMQALQEQENARRERVLVERLMRQCQQERRIATQLMAIRKEKETIRNNRVFRLQQHEEQRVREFNEALDRERELARCEVLERADKLKHNQQVYKQQRARKAKLNYNKDYGMCRDMLLLMVDMASKLAQYRELTKGLVPAKLVVDWKTLFVAGKSVYDDPPVTSDPPDLLGQSMTSSASSSLKKNNTELLDAADLAEYKEATYEWAPPIGFSDELPRPPNSIVGHIVHRLLDMVDPPKPPPSPPKFPKFILRASFIGRPFAGKSSIIRRLEQDIPLLNVLNPEALVTKAVATYLSEKRLLESHLSTEPMEGDQPTPAISVEPGTPMQSKDVPTVPQVEVTNDEEGSGPLGSTSSLSDQLLTKLSPLGQLGHKAYTAVTSGECVDDETVVEIIANEMRTFPDGSGFILDNFPVTLDQIHVINKVIVGGPSSLVSQSRNIQLLPTAADLSGDEKTVSDLIMFFDVSTDNVLIRASRTASGQSLSGNKLEQVQHRLLTFDTEWPQVRRWARNFMEIVTVNTNRSEDVIYEDVKDKVHEAINQAKHANAVKKLGLSRQNSCLSSGSTSNLISSPSKQKRSRSDFHSSPSRKGRRPSSASMLEAAASFLQAKTGTSTLSIAGSSEPGDPDWQYCDLPIKKELATGLADIWPSLERVYLSTLREVFQQLRAERETICHYFYDKRNEFKLYLKRPDTKQEFVSQWQSSYNSLPGHLRREDLMKAELHQRVDDLCEKLWDISDHRREGAGQERERILTDKWLEDHIGLLTNHYITLMQAELDRFYSTFLLLKDYYTGMEDKVPAKLPDPGRLPLIELSVTEAQDPPRSNVSSTHSMQEAPKKESEEPSSISLTSPKRTLSSRRKSKVPLLPRQLLPEPTEDKAPKKKGGGAAVVTPPPPAEDTSGLELDQQLVVHAYNTATAFVFTTVVHETRALEGQIADLHKRPAPHQPPEPPPPEVKEEKAGKGKKDKAKSPASKKGKTSPTKATKGAPPPPEPAPESPSPKLSLDEVARKQRAVLMHREHKAALQQEETRVKLRLELIKVKSLQQIETIKGMASELGGEMGEWLGETYKQEVDCVNSLAEILRQAIENEEKLLKEIVLPGTSLSIKESCLLSYPTPPPSPPPPTEPSHPHIFTVSQLLSLHTQLHTLFPDGYMLCSSLVETLLNLAEKSGDSTSLPALWTSLSAEQLEVLCEGVYGVGVDVVDWRRLLVTLAQPWTTPTPQQLVDTLTKYEAVGVRGRVSREQYQWTRTWLDESGEERDVQLKHGLFDMFSDASTDSLDYGQLLLYLCSDPSPGHGLLKAISLVTGGDVTSNDQATVSLEELNKALIHSSFPKDPPPISTSDLFDLFRMLSPTHPNEVAVCDLVHKESAWEYLTSISPHTLTMLEPFLRPVSRQTETD